MAGKVGFEYMQGGASMSYRVQRACLRCMPHKQRLQGLNAAPMPAASQSRFPATQVPLLRTRDEQALGGVPVHALHVAAVPRQHLLRLHPRKVPHLRRSAWERGRFTCEARACVCAAAVAGRRQLAPPCQACAAANRSPAARVAALPPCPPTYPQTNPHPHPYRGVVGAGGELEVGGGKGQHAHRLAVRPHALHQLQVGLPVPYLAGRAASGGGGG